MLVANFTTNRPEMGKTRTYEDFGKFLGKKAHKMGVLAKLYPENTITALTDLLGNIWMGEQKKSMGGFKSIDSNMVEWEVQANYIKSIAFAAKPEGNGAHGSEIVMRFTENYYQLEEIFKIDGSGQQCFVTTPPVREADNCWAVTVRLIDNDYSEVLDDRYCQPGDLTHWIGNAKPEMSDCGFVKYQSNLERMRNFTSLIRVEDSFSDFYKLQEDSLIKIAEGKGQGDMTEKIYAMDPMSKVLSDNFVRASEQMLLMAKTNMDINGKATISTRNTGREIVIGEGMIPQIERYCSKHVSSKITIATFQNVISEMTQKSDDPQGNHYIFVCNEQMQAIINRVLMKHLQEFKTDGNFFYSKVDGKNYKVGATFNSYEYNGNVISFRCDRTLTREYSMPFAMCIDFSCNKSNGNPAIQKFSMKGKDYMPFKMDGPGYGVENVSTTVAGGVRGIMGHQGLCVFNPYKSYLIYSTESVY
jgi:hypothetical protein